MAVAVDDHASHCLLPVCERHSLAGTGFGAVAGDVVDQLHALALRLHRGDERQPALDLGGVAAEPGLVQAPRARRGRPPASPAAPGGRIPRRPRNASGRPRRAAPRAARREAGDRARERAAEIEAAAQGRLVGRNADVEEHRDRRRRRIAHGVAVQKAESMRDAVLAVGTLRQPRRLRGIEVLLDERAQDEARLLRGAGIDRALRRAVALLGERDARRQLRALRFARAECFRSRRPRRR